MGRVFGVRYHYVTLFFTHLDQLQRYNGLQQDVQAAEVVPEDYLVTKMISAAPIR